MLAPDTPLHEARQLAEKLCGRVAAARLSEALPQPVTVSMGVAEYQAGEGFDAWLARADRALYEAKRAGRNRAVPDPLSAFGGPSTQPLAATLVKLMWRDAYNSGDADIDRQHRTLVEDIAEHFADEERLHQRIGYPDRGAHAAEHAKLLGKAGDLLEGAVNGPLVPAELFQFLAHEVVALHLLGADRRYFPYLDQQDGCFSGPA